jgi:small subunit ribosomal protein S5
MQPSRNDRRRPHEAPEEKQYDERIIHVNRVARVVKGGRRFRFQALVVVGDRKSKVGIGISKGADVTAAVTKATEVAKKHLITVNLYKGTVPHEALGKVGGAKILIKPAAEGTGLIAGGVVRTVLEVAGVSNVLSKSLGSTNKINTAYATLDALESMVPSKNWITTRNDNRQETIDKRQERTVATEKAPKKVAKADSPAKTSAKVAGENHVKHSEVSEGK